MTPRIKNNSNTHSWDLYLQLNGKRDRKAEREYLDPNSTFWTGQAMATLRQLAGELKELYLPWCDATIVSSDTMMEIDVKAKRALLALRTIGCDLDQLVAATLTEPFPLHPYESSRFPMNCPDCQRQAFPKWVDPFGFLYTCSLGHQWHVDCERAQELWASRNHQPYS